MLKRYSCNKNTDNNSLAGNFYINLFKIFDEDLKFMSKSILKYYMPFTKGFDPLFLEQSKNLNSLQR